MMPPASFTGSTKELSAKYRNCIQICKNLESQIELHSIESITTLHILQIQDRYIPYQKHQIFFKFSFLFDLF
jgi:hypothetical protein